MRTSRAPTEEAWTTVMPATLVTPAGTVAVPRAEAVAESVSPAVDTPATAEPKPQTVAVAVALAAAASAAAAAEPAAAAALPY
mmetsp:Transcript_37505/g.67856  ORF Transcript_37505/g.67856 Transcript_37505/m.67856 type:complete len:83 (+) Transcript_37505:632-880(+)